MQKVSFMIRVNLLLSLIFFINFIYLDELSPDQIKKIEEVTEDVNKNYYDIIQEYYNQTDCPIIFNTSFNLGGEPLVETLEDAVRTLIHSEIEYLYLPEYNKLVKVKNG